MNGRSFRVCGLGWLAVALLAACEGTGSADGGLTIVDRPIQANCTPLSGTFPSGLALDPGDPNRAAAIVFQPPGIATLRLGGLRPVVTARVDLPLPDTDQDGEDDAAAAGALLGRSFPVPLAIGEAQAAGSDLLLISTSNYEQVLVADLASGNLVVLSLETPANAAPDSWPRFPPPGETALRTAVSTFACVLPPGALDSNGDPIGANANCGGADPSFLTSITASKALAAGHLFVATSNLRPGRQDTYFPGTLLVFEWNDSGATPQVRPSVATPVIFTSGFNPTGVTRHVTPGGRELILVTVTGAIGSSTGASNVLTESFVDIIDAASRRVVASVPLGFAGPFFDAPAVDPSGRVALLGSTSQRVLFAVDLAPLDDPALYLPGQPTILLDGLTQGFPDARVASAENPIVLPDRPDGPPLFLCEGFTQVRFNAAGDHAFAIDECDGTLTRLEVDTSGSPPVPLPAARIKILNQNLAFAPTNATGLPRSPGNLRVRPGTPDIDYSGADVLVTIGEPSPSQVCALRVEAIR